jgi:hypothetical protein
VGVASAIPTSAVGWPPLVGAFTFPHVRGGTGLGRSFVVAAVAAIVLGACTAPPPPPPLVEAPSSPGAVVGPPACAAAAVRSCALPYPSDEQTVVDPSTPTGRRVQLSPELIPSWIQFALGPGAKLADVEEDADGFSPIGPVVFEVDRPVDPASLPADGGDVLRVYDLATGEPVPIRAELSLDSIRQGAPSTIVMAWPTVRWEPGHTYVARLRTGLVSPFGELSRPAGLDGQGEYITSVRRQLAEIEGDRWSSVLGATRFTVRSLESATRRFDAMVATARAEDHPVRNVEVLPPLLVQNAAAVVSGEVLLSDFRDEHGRVRPEHGPTPTWEQFMMVLPEHPAGPAGAPVAIYGHGLMAMKETMLFVAATNARRGIATIGIDVPNHGSRQGDEGGYLLDLATPWGLGRLVSMPLQGEIDTVSLVQALRNHLADLDVAGTGPFGWTGPDGRPDLDTTRLLYEGTSMGGVLGAAAVTATPELYGAFLQVPGSGIADILYHSQLWPLFAGVVPWGTSAGDAAALEGLATLLLDPADNTHLVERLRTSRFPVFIQYGVGDLVVPNWTTERLMALSGVPFVGEEISPLQGDFPKTGSGEIPADGRGAAQVYNVHSAPETFGFLAHVSFVEAQAERLLDDWLVNRLTAMGLAPA